MPAVQCKFWARGSCRNGNSCSFLHGDPQASTHTNNGRTAQVNGRKTGVPPSDPTIEKEIMVDDLTKELPQWILSAYQPSRQVHAQLFGGPRELSFEEMRLRHYEAANKEQAVIEAQQLYNNAQEQIQQVLNNVDGAVQHVLNVANEHPNRADICAGSGGLQSGQSGGQAQSTMKTGVFGQPSLPTTTSTWGQPSVPAQQPNPFNQTSSSVFGQPSGLGGSAPPAFGNPSGLGSAGAAFGHPSGPTFGQPSGLAATPSAFGGLSKPSNPFAAAAPARQTPFGQPSVPNPFKQTPFSNNAQPTQPAFGQPSTPNPFSSAPTVNSAPPNPFSSTTPFGQSSQAPATRNPFAPSTTQDQNMLSTTSPGPFSSLQTTGPNMNGAAQNNPAGMASHAGNPGFNAAPATSNGAMHSKPFMFNCPDVTPFPNGEHPPLNSYAIADANARLSAFKGMPVSMKNAQPGTVDQSGTWHKIWFPKGAPLEDQQTALPDEDYDQVTVSQYMHLFSTGDFKDGIIPFLPPQRKWLRFDF